MTNGDGDGHLFHDRRMEGRRYAPTSALTLAAGFSAPGQLGKWGRMNLAKGKGTGRFDPELHDALEGTLDLSDS